MHNSVWVDILKCWAYLILIRAGLETKVSRRWDIFGLFNVEIRMKWSRSRKLAGPLISFQQLMKGKILSSYFRKLIHTLYSTEEALKYWFKFHGWSWRNAQQLLCCGRPMNCTAVAGCGRPMNCTAVSGHVALQVNFCFSLVQKSFNRCGIWGLSNIDMK